jgi:hypothetical protein
MSDDGSLSDIITHRQVRRFYRDRTRDRVPLKWAMTQASLGISTALLILSERGSGMARLEEAIAAYRDALMERTRDHVPLDWATSFGNQGVAMILLAERNRIGNPAVRRACLWCSLLRVGFAGRPGGCATVCEFLELEADLITEGGTLTRSRSRRSNPTGIRMLACWLLVLTLEGQQHT